MAGNPRFDAVFFTNLRALADRPEFRFGFLVASREPLYKLCREHRIESSSFWNVFGLSKVLGLLSDEEARQLVVEPMARSLPGTDAQAAGRIWRQSIEPVTGRQPGLIQMAADAYWNALHGGYEADPTEVKQGLRPYLEDLWYRRTKDELAVLIRAAAGDAPISDAVSDDLRQRGLITLEGRPFSLFFGEVIEASLPKGKSLKDALADLEKGAERASKLLAQLMEVAEKAGKVYRAFKGSDKDETENAEA